MQQKKIGAHVLPPPQDKCTKFEVAAWNQESINKEIFFKLSQSDLSKILTKK